MILVDGGYLEGGGQVLRTSLTLSALLQKPFSIANIRKGRKNPGLRPQHLTAVKAMQEVCGAQVVGAELNSTELQFTPGRIRPKRFVFDVSEVRASAGSVSLIFQALCLPIAFSGGSKLLLRGGTHVSWSPCFEYLNEVFLPTVGRSGFSAELAINKYGFYPVGGGEIEAAIARAGELKPVTLLERGALKSIRGCSIVSNLPLKIAERQKTAALKELVDFGCEKKIDAREAPSPGKGTVLFIKAEYENSCAGFFSLGELGKPAETVAGEATEQFKAFDSSNAAVDVHLTDQLLLYAALAGGESEFSVPSFSDHLKTNAYAIKEFVPGAGIRLFERERTVRVKGSAYRF